MKHARFLIWAFPLGVLATLFLLYRADASRVDLLALKIELARAYGVSEGTVEAVATLLPDGWQFGDPIDFKMEPHEHGTLAGVEVIDDDSTGSTLVFAHLGDGHFGGQDEPLQTSYTVVNNTRSLASGNIEFFKDDGSPLELEIEGTVDSDFPFQLDPGSMQRFTTSGAGDLKSGWARIHSDQPVVVISSFGAVRNDGTVISDVGVNASELGTEFTIFADTVGSSDTGVALTNPHDDTPAAIEMILRDPAGEVVATDTIDLGPREHLALFLTQLFPQVPGMGEFEGTVVFKSAAVVAAGSESSGEPGEESQPVTFAGLTLRVSGLVFTSVPMVPPPQPGTAVTRLAFPQAADGELAGLNVSTTVVLFNNTDQSASGLIEFFKGDGTPNMVRVDGASTSSIAFEVAPRGVFRVSTDGVGEIAVGWARVSMDQTLAGVAIFTLKDGSGNIVSAVGVDSARLQQAFQLIVDTTGLFDTALALANPLEAISPIDGEPVQVRLNLKNVFGNFVGPEKTIELAPLQHKALFVTQLFPEVDFEGFEGRLEVLVSGSTAEYMVALSLRSAVEKLTSIPVFVRQRAFRPTVATSLSTNLRGSAPVVRWDVHQSRDDLTLREIDITLGGLALQTQGLRTGSELAFGYQDRPDGLYKCLARDVEADRLEYDLIALDEDVEIQGRGTIENVEDGVRIHFEDLDSAPGSYVFLDADTALFFSPGVFEIPQGAETVDVETTMKSALHGSRNSSELLRRAVQEIPLVDPDTLRANLNRISHSVLTATEYIRLEADNLGADPRVVFPGLFGLEFEPVEVSGQSLLVQVPPGVVPGPIRIDNGEGPGNGYAADVLFGPSFQMTQEEGTDTVSLKLSQQGDILAMEEDYEIRIYGVSVDFSELAVGQQVGIFGEGFSQRGLYVQSIAADMATLEIATSAGTGVTGTLIAEQLDPDTFSIRTPFGNEVSEVPELLLGSLAFFIQLDGLPFDFPEAGAIVFGEALSYSPPTDVTGVASRLAISQSAAFMR